MPGRHPKIALDYFPLYCNLGDKFEYLEAQCGLIGFAIVIKLFQKIYGERGYYCEFNEKKAVLLASKIKTGKDTVIKAVNVSVSEGIFNEELYKKYGILTSERIQMNYIEGTKRRTEIEILPEYALVDCAQNFKNANINSNSAYTNEEKGHGNEQKKEEVKVKDKILSSNERADVRVENTERLYHKLKRDYPNVCINENELDKLLTLLDEELIRHYYSVVEDNESRGHCYTKKSHSGAIIDMAKADGKLGNVKSGKRRTVKYGAFNAEDALAEALRRTYGDV